jgi:hypothetical protein
MKSNFIVKYIVLLLILIDQCVQNSVIQSFKLLKASLGFLKLQDMEPDLLN